MSNVIINNSSKTVTIRSAGIQGVPGLSWIDEGWSIGLNVPLRGALQRNGSSYRAIEAHTATSDNEPGMGANWEDVWVVIALRGNLTEEFLAALELAETAANSSLASSLSANASSVSSTASAASALLSSNSAAVSANSASVSATNASVSANSASVSANSASVSALSSAVHAFPGGGADVVPGGYYLATSTRVSGPAVRFLLCALAGDVAGTAVVELLVNGDPVTSPLEVEVGDKLSTTLSLTVDAGSEIVMSVLSVDGVTSLWGQVN